MDAKSALLVCFAILFWSGYSICDKKALQDISPSAILLIYLFCSLLTTPAIALLSRGTDSLSLNWSGVSWAISAEVFSTLAALCYLLVLRKNEVGVVSSLTSTYPAIVCVLSWYFLGEALTWTKILGVSLVTIGMILIAVI